MALRPRDAHVTKPPLLLHGIGVACGAAVRADAFFHPDHEHHVELEALGHVQRQQGDRVGALRKFVHICKECDFLQKRWQRDRDGQFRVSYRGRDQFADVGQPLFSILGAILQVRGIARLVQDQGQQVRQGRCVACFGQRRQQVSHFEQVVPGPPRQGQAGLLLVARHLVHAQERARQRQSFSRRPGRQAVYRLLADAARRQIDDAAQALVVIRVVHDAQVSQRVLDLPALEEPHTSHQAIRDLGAQEGVLHRTGLGVCAIHNRAVTVGYLAMADQPSNVRRDVLGLFPLVIRLVQVNGVARSVLGPQPLLDALRVVGDDGARRVQDSARGAVVLLEQDFLRVGVVLAETHHIAIVRPAPTVDALVLVTDDKDVAALLGQMPDDLILRAVRVLELIHQQMRVALLVPAAHVGVLAQQHLAPDQEIIEIQGVVLGQDLVVTDEGTGHRFVPVRRRAVGLGRHQIVFGPRNGSMHAGGLILLAVQVQFLERTRNDAALIVRIVDDKVLLHADIDAVSAQNPCADRVERADHEFANVLADESLQTGGHFARRLVREGHRQDLPGTQALFAYQPGDTVREDAGFAGAWAGQDEHRTARRAHRFLLLRVQVIEAHRHRRCGLHFRGRNSILASSMTAGKACPAGLMLVVLLPVWW